MQGTIRVLKVVMNKIYDCFVSFSLSYFSLTTDLQITKIIYNSKIRIKRIGIKDVI